MTQRTGYEAALDKRAALKNAENSGIVADSIDVRKALMERVYSGEITLESAQKELEKIKRTAKSQGKITRSQAFSRG